MILLVGCWLVLLWLTYEFLYCLFVFGSCCFTFRLVVLLGLFIKLFSFDFDELPDSYLVTLLVIALGRFGVLFLSAVFVWLLPVFY